VAAGHRALPLPTPQVGYCQGMNFVAGLLLMYLPERHAFGGLVVLMQDRDLRKYYSTDMSLIQVCVWVAGSRILRQAQGQNQRCAGADNRERHSNHC
jgi:hypothetical protein